MVRVTLQVKVARDQATTREGAVDIQHEHKCFVWLLAPCCVPLACIHGGEGGAGLREILARILVFEEVTSGSEWGGLLRSPTHSNASSPMHDGKFLFKNM